MLLNVFDGANVACKMILERYEIFVHSGSHCGSVDKLENGRGTRQY